MIPKHFLPNVVRLCGKLEMLDRLLPKLKATDHRVGLLLLSIELDIFFISELDFVHLVFCVSEVFVIDVSYFTVTNPAACSSNSTLS